MSCQSQPSLVPCRLSGFGWARWLTEELWQALVADRNSEGDDANHWIPLVLQAAVKYTTSDTALIQAKSLTNRHPIPMVLELFRRVQAVVLGRKLCRVIRSIRGMGI